MRAGAWGTELAMLKRLSPRRTGEDAGTSSLAASQAGLRSKQEEQQQRNQYQGD
jgi:hypothetical protein